MYRTAPPVLDRPLGTLPLRLRQVVRREPSAGTLPLDEPLLHAHFADMAALYGVEYRHDVLAANAGNKFGDLADAVLAGMVSPDEPLDLVIIAHVLPDLDPRFSPGARLTRTVPGEPLVFAVNGTDAAVGFTALRVAGAYARRHTFRRAVVLVLDQATLPYGTDAAPAELAGDAAVALLLADAPGAEVAVGRVPSVAPRDVAAVVADLVGEAHVIRADAPGAYPATGVWAGLDQESGGRSVLVHHDTHGDLHYCSIVGA